MAHTNDNANVSIAIRKIRELEYFYQEPSKEIKSSFERKNLGIGISLDFDLNQKNELFTVIATISYIYSHGKKKIPILRFSNLTELHVINMKTVLKSTSDDLFHLPGNIMANMVGVAVSSARGMIASKIAGSFISDYHLPIINYIDLLKKHTIKNIKESTTPKNKKQPKVAQKKSQAKATNV